VRFGVTDSDWKFVIFITLLSYSIPFFFNVKLLRFPLEIWTTVIAVVGSVAFFNFARIGRRPFWLQHQDCRHHQAITPSTRPPTDRRERPWLLADDRKK